MMKFDHPATGFYFGFSGQEIAWAILIIGLAFFSMTLFKRLKLIFKGKSDPRFDNIGDRIFFLIKDGFLQIRQPRYSPAGFIHIAIFWGFIAMGLHSIELVIGALMPGRGFLLMSGLPGALYRSLKEIFVLIVLVACITAIYQRAVKKPARYRDSRQIEAYLVLLLIIFLMVTDIFYEASKLALGQFENGVFLAARLARPIVSALNHEALIGVNHVSYWLHLIVFFLFLNVLPLSKHFHIITALPNVFFRRLNRGELKPPRWDAEHMEEIDEAGVNVITDFTWKHILDFYTCTECGRCTDNCPANAVGMPLSPKKMSMDIRDFGYRNSAVFSKRDRIETPIPGNVIQDQTFWSCTTCGACEEECPAFIEHIDKIIELRRRRVLMESRFPNEIEQIYRNIEIFGDAWGMGSALRTEWARGLNIKSVNENPDIEILFWVGCAGTFDTRAQQVSVAFSKVTTAAGVNFGILGEEECCCGDYARRTGNEYLFQMLCDRNIRIFEKYGVKKIVTACPHCFNTFKNEYPRFGGQFEVLHSTELINDLLKLGKLHPSKKTDKTFIWHDPCYLGRHNGIYRMPRNILSLIPGITVIEADKSRERSFCCGAGGGRFWMESSGQRINDVRVEQLLEKKTDAIATGCMYCLIMLEDGLESRQMKGQVLVKDIAEIAAEAL